MCCGHSLRMALPLGLNKCPPFHSISAERVIDTLLPPAESTIEDETRRNLFWLAYATDRTSGAGHGWAFGIDDDDVGQFLPVRGDLFDTGVILQSLSSVSVYAEFIPGPFYANRASMGPYERPASRTSSRSMRPIQSLY